MAVGTITFGKYTARIKILESLAAANTIGAVKPPATPDGTPAPSNTTGIRFDWVNRGNLLVRDMSIVVATRSGSGTIGCVARAYGWLDEMDAITANDAWFPLGKAAVEGDRGKLNDGVALAGTGKLRHSEPWQLATHLDGLYLELTSFAGTSPVFDAWVVVPLNAGLVVS